jgi:hypothetical protein
MPAFICTVIGRHLVVRKIGHELWVVNGNRKEERGKRLRIRGRKSEVGGRLVGQSRKRRPKVGEGKPENGD